LSPEAMWGALRDLWGASIFAAAMIVVPRFDWGWTLGRRCPNRWWGGWGLYDHVSFLQ